MLLPKIFPIARSAAPEVLANKFTTNSGIDVPNATIVRPITIAGTFHLFAREEAHSTSKSAPLMSAKNQTTKRIYVSIYMYKN